MPAFHLKKAFTPVQLRRIAAEMEQRRRSLGAEVVVVRGLSGIMVATAMSTLFETPIAVIRKPNEQSHGISIEMVDYKDDGYTPVVYNRWIIIDDMIASGATVRSIIETVECSSHIRGKCAAILLYYESGESSGMHRVDTTGQKIPVYQIGEVK